MKLLLPLLILLTLPQETDPFVILRWSLYIALLCGVTQLVLIAVTLWQTRKIHKPCVMLGLLFLGVLSVSAQEPGKRFQCKVDTDGESIKLVQCQYEDEEHMLKESFTVGVIEKWQESLRNVHHGEATAHFEETAKEVCLRQVRPLDGFIRHPVQEDLNLCKRKGRGWKR